MKSESLTEWHRASIGNLSSALKIRRTELKQKIDELTLLAVDHYAMISQPEVRVFNSQVTAIGSETAACAMPRYLNNRDATVYAGSNEVQRNILAKHELGL